MSGGLAYVVSRFPRLTETFTLREMQELQRQGRPVDLFAIHHQREAVRHPEVAPLEAAAQFLEPLSGRTLHANVRLLRRAPRRYARLLGDTIVGNRWSADFLVKGLAVLPGTVELAERMRSRGVRHIHAQFATHPALLALLAADIIGVGFSFTVHAHDLFVNPTMLAEKVRRARFVVAISEFNRERLSELTGSSATRKFEVIRCGVDLATYRYRPPRPHVDVKSILAVGSLRAYKGLDRLVRACALLREAAPGQPFMCTIVGEGPLRRPLAQLIADLRLEAHVRLLGGRDQHAVHTLMEASDTMVLPSVVAPDGQMEGIPVALMEAMAVGVPVIASDLSGIPELVRHGDTGLLVAPDDPGAIRDAVLACWRSPAEAAERADRGRQLVEREYDLRKNVARLAALYDRALATSGAAGGRAGARRGREA